MTKFKMIWNKIKQFFLKLFKKKDVDMYGIQIGNNKFDKFTKPQSDSFGIGNGREQMDLDKLIAFEQHTTNNLDTWFKVGGTYNYLKFDTNKIVDNRSFELYKERSSGKNYGLLVKNKTLHSDLKYFENQKVQISEYEEQRKVKFQYGAWEEIVTVQHFLYIFEAKNFYMLSDIAQWIKSNEIKLNSETNDFYWTSDGQIKYIDRIGKYALDVEIFINRGIKRPNLSSMVVRTAS